MEKLRSFQWFRMWNSATEDVNAYFPVRPECQADVPRTRFKPRGGRTLSQGRWNAAFSQDGHLDIAGVLRRIQREGIHPSIKGVVWEFLLGCFDPNSTYDERSVIRQKRREKYASWKAKCQEMVPAIGSGKVITAAIVTDDDLLKQNSSINCDTEERDGALSNNDVALNKKMIQWKLGLHQIGLDVVRTDRALVFYEDEGNLARLWDILAVYAWLDHDIGYVQGMSDICSPMVILLENEADAFWCFNHAMRRLRSNFRSDASSIGVQSQLSTLSQIMKVIDPKLHLHIEEIDGGEYLFAIRMLMVLFRREFSFIDALYLWEVMWAMEYNPNMFALYENSRNSGITSQSTNLVRLNSQSLKQYGKFERKYVKDGAREAEQKSALAVFMVASILETRKKRFMKEAKDL